MKTKFKDSILSHLRNPRFKKVLEEEDLKHISGILTLLSMTPKEEDVNKALLRVDKAVVLAGYLDGKYGVKSGEADHNLSIIYSSSMDRVRRRLMNRYQKFTNAMVDSDARAQEEYQTQAKFKFRCEEVAQVMHSIRSAVYRRHDSLLEISRNERQAMRGERD